MSLGQVFNLLIAFGLVMVFVHRYFFPLPWYIPALVLVIGGVLFVILLVRRLAK